MRRTLCLQLFPENKDELDELNAVCGTEEHPYMTSLGESSEMKYNLERKPDGAI